MSTTKINKAIIKQLKVEFYGILEKSEDFKLSKDVAKYVVDKAFEKILKAVDKKFYTDIIPRIKMMYKNIQPEIFEYQIATKFNVNGELDKLSKTWTIANDEDLVNVKFDRYSLAAKSVNNDTILTLKEEVLSAKFNCECIVIKTSNGTISYHLINEPDTNNFISGVKLVSEFPENFKYIII